jgi:hypothetical protein
MATGARLAEAEPKAHLDVTRRGSRSLGSPGYLGLSHAASGLQLPELKADSQRAWAPSRPAKRRTVVVATRKALMPGHY